MRRTIAVYSPNGLVRAFTGVNVEYMDEERISFTSSDHPGKTITTNLPFWMEEIDEDPNGNSAT